MNTIKLSAALTAAVLAGALSTAAYAADAERPASRITVSGGSIILKKAINLDKAPGAGGIKGTITFNVAAGQDGDLPQAHTADEMLGTADQLASTTATAEFTADAQGKASTESDVTVDFNMDKFTKPGIYYYRLAEQAHGISGLSTAPLYLLRSASPMRARPSRMDSTSSWSMPSWPRKRPARKPNSSPTSTRPTA